MRKMSLDAIAREQLENASNASSRRASVTVHGGHELQLRQVVVALCSGAKLAEHANPGEATVQVLTGRARLIAGEDSWDGRKGDLLIVPDGRHELEALEDCAVLLTVVKRS